jgi:hypothetical protein
MDYSCCKVYFTNIGYTRRLKSPWCSVCCKNTLQSNNVFYVFSDSSRSRELTVPAHQPHHLLMIMSNWYVADYAAKWIAHTVDVNVCEDVRRSRSQVACTLLQVYALSGQVCAWTISSVRVGWPIFDRLPSQRLQSMSTSCKAMIKASIMPAASLDHACRRRWVHFSSKQSLGVISANLNHFLETKRTCECETVSFDVRAHPCVGFIVPHMGVFRKLI